MDTELIQQALMVREPYRPTVKSQPLKNGELLLFEQSIQAKKASECSDEEIKQALRYCMLLVGVRAATLNGMEEEEKLVLINFIKSKYNKHTIEEIKVAFTKAAAYELDVDPKHYENFSCEYFGRIIGAYRVWASEMNNKLWKLKREQEEYNQLPSHEKYNPVELVNIYYQEFLKGEFNLVTASSTAYDTAVRNFNISFDGTTILQFLKQSKSEDLAYCEKILLTNRGNLLYRVYDKRKKELTTFSDAELLESHEYNRKVKILLLNKWFEMLKEQNVQDLLNYKPNE